MRARPGGGATARTRQPGRRHGGTRPPRVPRCL